MLLVLKNKLKGLTQKEYYFLKSMCRNSKNVYNATLYEMRQHFFKCGERLTYATAYHTIKNHHAYKSIPSLASQQSMMMVDRAYASFFGLLRSKRLGLNICLAAVLRPLRRKWRKLPSRRIGNSTPRKSSGK